MASSIGTGLDHMVAIKMAYQGSVRRAKMPLREMVPPILEANVRSCLHIPSNAVIVIERWSDSLGAFVKLESDNASVYKQLYRAAKAKSKLKLRISVVGPPQTERSLPLPVTIEDEPESNPHMARLGLFGTLKASTSITNACEEPVPVPALASLPSWNRETAETPEVAQNNETATEVFSTPLKEPAAEPLVSTPPSVQLPLRTLRPPQPAAEPAAESIEPTEPAKSESEPIEEPSFLRTATRGLVDLIKEEEANPPPLWEEEEDQQSPIPWPWSLKNTTSQTPAYLGLSHPPGVYVPSFAVCCNKCNCNVSDAHFHCSTCDDGDFDLCVACVEQGYTCKSDDHWLIKRTMVDGQLVCSSTETIAPKPRETESSDVNTLVEEAAPVEETAPIEETVPVREPSPPPPPSPKRSESPAPAPPPACPAVASSAPFGGLPTWMHSAIRTCNGCVQAYPSREFLHCDVCEDFDLCRQCFFKDNYGHHPRHTFAPAVPGTEMPAHVTAKLGAGRNRSHHAICDGCDMYITGVRHKCLDCPDWDYCDDCIVNADVEHTSHRFVPLYEPLESVRPLSTPPPVHMGICCDGPLCNGSHGNPSYIWGVRYKCAVCHDTDFCANCEAHPLNEHNKTHPLIKFKTPVRHVSVTTTGEHLNGKRMPTMGDRSQSSTAAAAAKAPAPVASNTINAVQTVVDVKPEEAFDSADEAKRESELKVEDEGEDKTVLMQVPHVDTVPPPPAATSSLSEELLKAVFIRDTVPDGTILAPNHVFEQTWFLRNEGNVSWPAGCSVKFVGGDYMGHVDSAHPAGISELVSASESTICYAPLAPGQAFPFTVLLRTPLRAGKITSYWRLTTPEGLKFGHRLWCEVSVRATAAESPAPTVTVTSLEAPEAEVPSQSDSVMIFPKLDAESTHSLVAEKAPSTVDGRLSAKGDQSDSFDGEEWDGSDDDFMTDEEYDILDASDEESVEYQSSIARK